MATVAQFRGACAGVTTDGRSRRRRSRPMKLHAAITLLRPLEEAQRLWQDSGLHPGYLDEIDARVTFHPAPGDRGTEIHVTIEHDAPGGKVGEVVDKVRGAMPRASGMDELRRFKQRVETGVIVRSDGTPRASSPSASSTSARPSRWRRASFRK